jgi:formiminotetrahydrofolate cyclodeaminase
MPTFMDLSARQLLDALSAPTPTPGGGTAAALAGAFGTSLVCMVASLPKTRTAAPEARDALNAALASLRPALDRLVELVDEDSAAYDSVMSAYRMPKGTDADTKERQDAIQAGLRHATDVPLEVMRLCELAARQAIAVARHGSTAASSDLGVGLELLQAACNGAALNVKVNLGQIRDGEYAARVSADMRRVDAELDRALAQAREALG